MTGITDFRHPTETAALDLAHRWCAGQQIAGQRALTHALDVAGTLRQHLPDPDPDIIAAILLHDAPDFAPPGIDLQAVLATRVSPQAARIIAALDAEHTAMDIAGLNQLVQDQPVLLASAADKLVSITNVLNRPSGPPPGFQAALSYLEAFNQAAHPHLPETMATQLDELLRHAQE